MKVDKFLCPFPCIGTAILVMRCLGDALQNTTRKHGGSYRKDSWEEEPMKKA